MANFLEQQYHNDNINTVQPEKHSLPENTGQTSNFLEQQYVQDNPGVKNQAPLPGISKENSILDYALAPFKGMAQEASGPPSQAGTYGMYDNAQSNPFDVSQDLPSDKRIQNQEYSPSPPKDQLEASLRGAGKAINAPNLVLGPGAAIPGAIGSAVTDWRNAADPSNPGWNNVLGLVASLAPYGAVSKVFAGNNVLTQAWKDLGLTGVTAAGIGPEKSFTRTVRAMRESPFSDAVNQAEGKGREQLAGNAERMASDLGASSDPAEAGNAIRDSLGVMQGTKPAVGNNWLYNTQKDLNQRSLDLDRNVDPKTTLVDISDLAPSLEKELLPPSGAFQIDKGADTFIKNLVDGIKQHGMGAAGYIPLDAIKYLKRGIGDQLDMGMFSMSDTTERNLMTMWAKLSDVEKSAYAGTSHEQTFNNLQNDWAQYFNNRKSVKDLIDQNNTTDSLFGKVLSEKAKGGTKLDNIFSLAPDARGEVASAYLRQMGMDAKGEFNPDRFFKQWSNNKVLSQEAKQALFGDVDGDIPKAYDQLALASQEQARSESARNFSGTAGTHELLRFARNLTGNIAKFGGIPAAATGAYGAYNDQNPEQIGKEAGLAGLASYATAMTLGPKLFTFGPFVRLLAKDPPIQTAPLLLKAFATEYPQVAPEVTTLSNYITRKQDQSNYEQRKEERHFLNGGYASLADQNPSYADGGQVGPYMSANSNNPPDKVTGSFRSGWDQIGVAMPFQNESILDLVMKPAFNPKPPANDYAGGGRVLGTEPSNLIPYDADTLPASRPAKWLLENPTRGTFIPAEKEQLEADSKFKNQALDSYNLPTRFDKAVEQLNSMGIHPDAAKGAVKYMYLNESKLDPNAVNPTSKALGIGQWLGPRKEALIAKYGNNPTFDQQMEHLMSELKGPEKKAFQALLDAKDEKTGYSSWGSLFERPGQAALNKAGVNYKSGNIHPDVNSNTEDNSEEGDDKALLDQFLGQEEDQPDDNEEKDKNSSYLDTIMNASWINPEVKFVSGKILS